MNTMKIIRDEIAKSPVSRYKISQDTGITQAVLCRVATRGSGLNVESADILLEYFGYKIVKVRKP